jgi:hypothetical protein
VVALAENIDEDAVVEQAFALKPITNAALDKEIDGALFQNSGTYALDHVIPGAVFHNDGVDTRQVQQVSQHQTRGARTYNSDLSTYCFHLPWGDFTADCADCAD